MQITLPVASLVGRLAATPVAYLLLWSGSLVLSIVLVVLLRTRWGQSRPLHKCAVLSLLVHLLLAWAAMTLHIMVGDGGGTSGSTVRVRILHDVDPELALADVPEKPDLADAPPLLQPVEEEVPPPPVDEPTAAVAEVVDSPPAAEPAANEADQQVAAAEAPTNEPAAPDETAPSTEPIIASESTEAADAEPSQEAVAHESTAASEPTTAAVEPTPPAPEPETTPTPATPYALRTAPGRLALVERQGGNARTEAAVAAALRWLAAAQSRDGRWDANHFGAGQEQAVLGHNRGGAGRGADTGISALALLAFLGAGHSHLDGDYQDTVRRGLDFLLRSQAADGSLFGNATLYAQMYCHSMATFALAEAQAMTGDRRLEPAVLKAVGFSLAAQNATSGGWRYRPGDSGDTSQLGWQMMALASAERADIQVPEQAWIRVERFLRSVRRGNYGGLASYRPDSGPSTVMTAEALYCRLLLGQVLGETIDESAAAEATTQMLATPPDAGRLNLYYWYYATLALHHRHQHNDRAAADWRAWNESLTAALLATQIADGRDVGSWDTNCVWGGYGGRVYSTAMAAMCLEVYYRYAPPPPARRDRWTATRPDPHPPRQ